MELRRISLTDPIFTPAVASVDVCLQKLINKMQQKQLTEGRLSLGINLEFDEEQVTDPDTGAIADALTPKIKFKVTYTIKDSESIDGDCTDAGKVIVSNGVEWCFGRTDNGQQSMF